MYPPNVLVAPRLLDCVPPYVNSPFTSYIPPPVSLCLPPPAPSHLPPPTPNPPHSCVRSKSASASWSWATVSPHQRGCLCCITALCPSFRDTCFFSPFLLSLLYLVKNLVNMSNTWSMCQGWTIRTGYWTCDMATQRFFPSGHSKYCKPKLWTARIFFFFFYHQRQYKRNSCKMAKRTTATLNVAHHKSFLL